MSNKSLPFHISLKARTRRIYALLIVFWLASGLLAVSSAQANKLRPTILVWGDSLSAAYRMEESQGWVALLQQKLISEGSDWQVVNGSVSGETTDGGLARLPAMLASTQPDIVILELGGNDGLRGLPVRNIRQNLTRMIELSQQAGARVLLAGIQIPPNYGPRYTTPFYAQYNELAEEYGLALIPFLLEGIADRSELMQDDGIHPTSEAQRMILDIVWPELQALIQADS